MSLKIFTFDEYDDGECVEYTRQEGELVDKNEGWFSTTFVIKLNSGTVIERPKYKCFYNERDRDNEISSFCDYD